MAKKYIKTTKYCSILKQGIIEDEEYRYCIERVFIKSKKREEIRFSLYKDTITRENRYIPRSLDVTELEFLDLIRASIKEKVFSMECIEMLKQIIDEEVGGK